MSISTIHGNGSNVYQPLESLKRKENERFSQPEGEKTAQKDEYLPDEPVGSPVKGIYSLGRDEEGNPEINYVDPHSEEKPVSSDEREESSVTTTNTDRVDGEIKKLKEEQLVIQQRIRAEQDEEKRTELESQLQQVANQFLQKDNDFYRRQNAVVS